MSAKERDSLSDGRIALAKLMTWQWFVAHGKEIFYSAVAISALLFFLFSWNQRFAGGRSDYLKVEAAFSTWIAQEKHDSALFKQVSEPIQRHPELAAKFGGMIAQRLLTLGETQLAQSYAEATLKRTKNALFSPYHALFSENTLLISQGRLKEALEAAHQLKLRMAADGVLWEANSVSAGRTLYAYNLLRIAALEREVGSRQGEWAAWDEVIQNAGWSAHNASSKTCDSTAFKIIAEHLQRGEVSLISFIQQRRLELQAVTHE